MKKLFKCPFYVKGSQFTAYVAILKIKVKGAILQADFALYSLQSKSYNNYIRQSLNIFLIDYSKPTILAQRITMITEALKFFGFLRFKKNA